MENSAKNELDESEPKTNNDPNESIISNLQNVLKQRYMNVTDIARSGAFRIGGASLLWFMGYFDFSWLWIVIFVSVMIYMTEKRKRKETSSEIAKRTNDNPREFVQAMTEVYRMSAKDLPSWIYYPDVEKAEWLNNILQKLWPFIGDFARNLLTNEIQTKIRESHSLLSEFAFTDVDLGQRAPRVAGIKVHGDEHTRRDEIVIDMQIVYEGDCNIGVGVSFLEAGIRDFKLRGLMRFELKPLIDTLPLVGAVSVSFVKDPTIDFDLTELANLLDFPGFSNILRGAIADSVGSLLVLPEKYIVKLKPDIDISRLRFPLPKGMVRIHIIEAENLAEKDKKFFGLGGKSDPFVVVKVGHQSKFKTKTIEHTINPKWNESFDSLVRDVEYGNITFNVYDDDGALTKDDFLGKITISVKKVYERGIINEKIKLMDTDTGRLSVRLEWFDLTADRKIVEETLAHCKGTTNCALLSIYVDGAVDLPNNPDDSYDPSPYLKITTPSGDVLKTKTVSSNNNPVWEENFRILLKQPLQDEIKFEVEDDRNDAALLGNLKMAVKRLFTSTDMMVDHPFLLDNSNGKASLNLRMSLRVFELKQPPADVTSNGDVFTVTAGPRMAANRSGKDEANTSTSRPEHARRDSNASASSSGSASSDHESTTEENAFALDNLRKRLNAKKKDTPPENNSQSDPGLGRIRLTIRHHNNTLAVIVHNAENLIICDEDDKTSDPYVKIAVIPHHKKHKKTKVMKNNLNPTFEQQLEFPMSLKDASQSRLNVTVNNQTGFLSWEKTMMGGVKIDLARFDLTQQTTQWYYLQLPEDS